MVGGGIMTCVSAFIGEYCADFSSALARLLLKDREAANKFFCLCYAYMQGMK